MSHKFHGLLVTVQQWVSAELLDRNCPRQPLWPWSLFLAQNGENCRRYAGPTARSKQSEMSCRVPIKLGNVL
jgi:hypothetical protein